MSVLRLCFHFNKIHDCVEKASSTAAKQDRMTANSHQLSFSFDQVLILGHLLSWIKAAYYCSSLLNMITNFQQVS